MPNNMRNRIWVNDLPGPVRNELCTLEPGCDLAINPPVIGECDQRVVCRDCAIRCYHCEDVVCSANNRLDDPDLCIHCYHDTSTCESCGTRENNDFMHYDRYNEESYCYSCYEDLLSQRQADEDQDNDDCDRIDPYYPSPGRGYARQGYALDGIYYGVEVEMERGKGYQSIPLEPVYRLQGAASKNAGLDGSNFSHKYDGSLNNGVECVTDPMSPDLISDARLWGWLPDAVSAGWRAYKAGRCGLHIHASRFTASYRSDSIILDAYRRNKHRQIRIATLVYSTPFFRRISRRETFNYCKFPECSRSLIRWGVEPADRYVAFNVTPLNTVEFRFWRGSLVKADILGMIELTIALVQFADQREFKPCNAPRLGNYLDFLLTHCAHENAIKYINQIYPGCLGATCADDILRCIPLGF